MVTIRLRNITLMVGTETPCDLFERLLAKPDPPDLRGLVGLSDKPGELVGRGHRYRYCTAVNPDRLKQHFIFRWMQNREIERGEA
jgi:hypothetical protein